MASHALTYWQTTRASALDEIAAAHAQVGGSSRGRRYATAQLNAAYAMLLSSQFQGFCRDLHTECSQVLIAALHPAAARPALELLLTSGKRLDAGNPNAGNLGSDFGRFGIRFWDRVFVHRRFRKKFRNDLDMLSVWRNAIAHQDFSSPDLRGRSSLRLAEVRAWRRSVSGLGFIFDDIMRAHLLALTGTAPW